MSIGLRRSIGCVAALFLASAGGIARAQTLEGAFAFGSRNLECPTFNDPETNYTMVHHSANSVAAHDALAYDPGLGWGFEVTNEGAGGRNGAEQFGPFDDSPNNRNRFGDSCPEELYDSFIGFKNFADACDEATAGGPNEPCSPPEGGIFRVDVPNGLYRFVAVIGEADNPHAHRVIAEDGGGGPPENVGANHVVLVKNHDQAQYTTGQARADRTGAGVFAHVGFGDKQAPPGDGTAPDPVFVNMNENGEPSGGDGSGAANSPTLNVTQGYVRVHLLQGNSNPGPGGPDGDGNDPNGGDIVLLELWRIGEAPPVPAASPIGLIVLVALLALGGAYALSRRLAVAKG